mmetsp:Transcript_14466/g.27219  ORF Transcript_14466/g.27219 Transcript_14466/m.27219 type:complete len:86 (+) Transcript_14466:32-289(+)
MLIIKRLHVFINSNETLFYYSSFLTTRQFSSKTLLVQSPSSICTCKSFWEHSRLSYLQRCCNEPKYTKPSTIDNPYDPLPLHVQV